MAKKSGGGEGGGKTRRGGQGRRGGTIAKRRAAVAASENITREIAANMAGGAGGGKGGGGGQNRRGGQGRRGGKGGGGGGGGGSQGASVAQLHKAIRREVNKDNVPGALVAYSQLRDARARMDGQTVHMLAMLLISHGHLRPALELLREVAPYRPLTPSQLPEALSNLPQTIDSAAAAAVVDALVGATAFADGDAAAEFFRARARWVVMEFADEARSALDAIAHSDPWVLARQGRCVLGCALSAGGNSGELLATGGMDAGSDVRRPLSIGDTVSLRLARPPAPAAAPTAAAPADEYGEGALPSARSALSLLEGSWIEAEVVSARPLVLKPVISTIASSVAGLVGAPRDAEQGAASAPPLPPPDGCGGGGAGLTPGAGSGPPTLRALWSGAAEPPGGGSGVFGPEPRAADAACAPRVVRAPSKNSALGGGSSAAPASAAAGREFRVDKLANRITLERTVRALAAVVGGSAGAGLPAGSPAAPIVAALLGVDVGDASILSRAPTDRPLVWPATDPSPAPPAGARLVREACALPRDAGMAADAAQPGGGLGAAGGSLAERFGLAAAAAAPGGGQRPAAAASADWRMPGAAAAAAPGSVGFVERFLGGLNQSQADAVRAAFERRLTLIQGPPGTGKTRVAVRVLLARVRAGDRCLAASDSNIAVDNLLSGLVALGLRAVRVGRPESTRPDLLPYCADEIGLRAGGRRSEQLQARMRAVQRAEVVCATCVGAGAPVLDRQQFHTVLVDEACQATDAATIVPLTRGCQSLVLVGDQCQLPPTVTSEDAKAGGAAVSLFERLLLAGVAPHMLRTQYRMHPAIAAFPSDCFYQGAVDSGVRAAERPAPPGFSWPRAETPVAFLHTLGAGGESSEGVSKLNQAEAEVVAHLVHSVLYAGGLRAAEVGVISPYAAQCTLLKRALSRSLGREHGRAVEVASVDGFQGREKELMVVSTVRANARGSVGFLADWRRANVALTRAKRGLIVVGDAQTLLREHRAWAPFLHWCSHHGVLVGHAPLPGGYDPAATRALGAGTPVAMLPAAPPPGAAGGVGAAEAGRRPRDEGDDDDDDEGAERAKRRRSRWQDVDSAAASTAPRARTEFEDLWAPPR